MGVWVGVLLQGRLGVGQQMLRMEGVMEMQLRLGLETDKVLVTTEEYRQFVSSKCNWRLQQKKQKNKVLTAMRRQFIVHTKSNGSRQCRVK